MSSGIYIVTLENDQPISVNANDPRIADKAIKVNKRNCKVGKAQDLDRREKNYCKVFGLNNVNFTPIVKMRDIDEAEKAILSRLDRYRHRTHYCFRLISYWTRLFWQYSFNAAYTLEFDIYMFS